MQNHKMLNIIKDTKTKPKLKPTLNTCVRVTAYNCRTQHSIEQF